MESGNSSKEYSNRLLTNVPTHISLNFVWNTSINGGREMRDVRTEDILKNIKKNDKDSEVN